MKKAAVFLGVAVVCAILVVTGVLFLRGQARPDDTPAPQAPVTTRTEEPPASKDELEPDAASDVVEPQDDAAEPSEDTGAMRFYGVVLDAATDRPVADAAVSVLISEAEAGKAVTDASGAYSIEVGDADRDKLLKAQKRMTEALPEEHAAVAKKFEPDAGMVTCEAKGYAHTYKPLAHLDGKETEVRTDFVLRPGSSVSGKVTDKATGQGIAEIEMSAYKVQQSFIEAVTDRARAEATTGEDGAYTVAHLEPAAYTLMAQARKAGYVFGPEDVVTLHIEEGVAHEGVDFALERGAVVQGVVKNASGEAVSKARVHVRPAQMVDKVYKDPLSIAGALDLYANANEDGHYEVIGLDFDAEYRLSVKADGYAETLTGVFSVARDRSPARVDIQLTRGSTVSGRARYEDGEPAADYELMLFFDFGQMLSGAFTEPKKTKTDTTGAFTFERVSAGKFVLMSAEGPPNVIPFLTQKQEAVPIEVDGIHDLADVEMVVARKGAGREAEAPGTGVIDGTVLDASGAPAAQVHVTAAPRDGTQVKGSATTKPDGTFTLTKLRGRAYDLSVTSDKGNGGIENVAIGATVTIRLAAPVRVSGQVVDGAGQSVQGCKVQLIAQDETAAPDFDPEGLMGKILGFDAGGQTTDENGFFEFRNVDPGQYVVKARSPAKGSGESRVLTVYAGQDVTGLIIRLNPGVTFAGSVEDASGRAVEGASVNLIASKSGDPFQFVSQFMPPMMQKKDGQASTDANGRFEILNLAPGTYVLRASHSQYATTVQEDIHVAAGRNVTNHRVVLTVGGRAAGQLVVDGEPRANVMIQLVGPNGMQMTTTDSEGRFDITGITPGSYLAQTVDMNRMAAGDLSGQVFRQMTVEIGDGEIAEVDFSPPAGSMPVAGAVSGELGTMTTVSLRRAGGLAPEEINAMDFAAQIEQAQYLAGVTFVNPDGSFEMEGIAPGDYILEVYSLDFDPMKPDIGAMMNMDRTPAIRQEITVEDGQPPTFQLDLTPVE